MRAKSTIWPRRPLGVGLAALACVPMLSGCLALAVPLMAVIPIAGMGAGGYILYKSLETKGEGRLSVGFAGSNDAPTPPLGKVQVAAVLPHGQRETVLEGRLERVTKVVSPADVSRVLGTAGIGTATAGLPDAQRQRAFGAVCAGTNASMVFAAKDEPGNTKGILRTQLMGYSCALRSIAWQDQMSIESSSGNAPVGPEATKLAGEAWADRVLAAMQHR